jgi:hypothetical protein
LYLFIVYFIFTNKYEIGSMDTKEH